MVDSAHAKLRVGLLMDSFDVPAWQYSMLAQIKNSTYAAIDLVVLNGSLRAKRSLGERLWANRDALAYIAYSSLDRRFFRSNPDAFAHRNALELLAGTPTLTIRPRSTRHVDWITDDDIQAIKRQDLDVLIRFGFRILNGQILDAARAGVWSYHHGDNDDHRGGPAGFWEVLEAQPTTGVVLQCLTPDLDNGIILSRSYSRTDHLSVDRNRNNCYWKALSLIPRKLKCNALSLSGEVVALYEYRRERGGFDVGRAVSVSFG